MEANQITEEKNELSLEDTLKQLEGIVSRLSGEIPLEQALALYEQGVRLAQDADGKIKSAKLRVTQLSGKETGESSENV